MTISQLIHAFFFGDIDRPTPRNYDPRDEESCSGDGTEEESGSSVVCELAKANPDTVEDYCDQVVAGTASCGDLFKALPFIKQTVTDPDYNSTDRIRIRNSLKKVLFNTKLERSAQINLNSIILALSEAY